MADITLFILKYCPYCRQALKYIDDLKRENPAFNQLEIEIVDEAVERERARKMDYYYVPTFYVGGNKAHEGAVSHDQVASVLREAQAQREARGGSAKR